MNNVIVVDFNKRTVFGNKIDLSNISCIDDYYEYLASRGLDTEDILDLDDAINDLTVYQCSDPVIQDLANFWFSHSAQI